MDKPLCPVDHSKRGEWMEKMKSNPETEKISACPVDHSSRAKWLESVSVSATAPEAIEVKEGCTSESLGDPKYTTNTDLPTEREVSSIPRTDTRSNWIYPSQKQFYEAMKRKNWNPEAEDMQSVVPIHNSVNELAWNHILNWERTFVQDMQKKCGGISLTSFRGDLKNLTPRAWVKLTLLGYEKPFDRHDWTVDRCGVEVPYVIDFYGSETGVFVDVRPKLNSWEGVKLRLGRALGWA